ncbi:MAG: endonuclease domain-containing protein [Gammaproteobacteria bacterium]|nr:endonuclease domain-containing protein [Gammaproteobacteria bacterium]
MSQTKTAIARKLRSRMTDAERHLWQKLRTHQLGGVKFRRQTPLGRYIADFVCFDAKLIVEVDGGQHADSAIDQVRDVWLQARGYRVLRFWNNEVLANVDAVLAKIAEFLPPHPNPLPRGERGLDGDDRDIVGTTHSLSPGGRGPG